MSTHGTADEEPDRWTAKGMATRARIVTAAADLMHKRGVANTGLEDIRRAARISNSQLYHYFHDKTDLVRAVVAHQGDKVVGSEERLWSQLDSFEALRAWQGKIVSYVSQTHGYGGCPIGSLASELADIDEGARIALDANFTFWETAIRSGLVSMRERGELSEDADPAHLALATLAALQGGLLLSKTRRHSEPVRVALDAAIGHIRCFAAQP
ncbi:MAG TPA: TetR/AcrR family transcriptional regulator [Mycobacterium sp.]|nr:TetR/AcrR family transcriptional regulator [Mycobacterium sp.]